MQAFITQFMKIDDKGEIKQIKKIKILEKGGVSNEENISLLEIFIYYDDLLKYIYSFGEKMDSKTHKESYMTYTKYMKLLNYYCLFPSICHQLQAKRTFKIFEFQKNKIDFRGFVSSICVFANSSKKFFLFPSNYDNRA